jgi:hypothetical protein
MLSKERIRTRRKATFDSCALARSAAPGNTVECEGLKSFQTHETNRFKQSRTNLQSPNLIIFVTFRLALLPQVSVVGLLLPPLAKMVRSFAIVLLLTFAVAANTANIRGGQGRRLSKSSSSSSSDRTSYAYSYQYSYDSGPQVQGNTFVRSSNGNFVIVKPNSGSITAPVVIPRSSGTGATVIVPGAPITTTSVTQYSSQSSYKYNDSSSSSSSRRRTKK